MNRWCKIISIIDSKREDNETKFHVIMKYNGNTLGAWLPYRLIPSQNLLRDYHKRVFNVLSKQLQDFDYYSRKIYNLLGECQDFELDSLRREHLTIQGLVLPHSNKIQVFQRIKQILRDPSLCDTLLDDLRRDILVEKLIEKRAIQLINLKAREWQINIISDNRKDITIINDIDFEEFPSHLIYVNRYIIDSDSIPDGVMIKCDCVSEATCTGNSCFHYFRDSPQINSSKGKTTATEVDDSDPYDENGRILLDPKTAVYECNILCKCDETCPKRVVQNGANLRLEIFKTWNDCGWGVRTLEDIPARTFVSRYAGEVISWEEAERRGHNKKGDYLFDIDFNFNPDDKHCPFTVDAYTYGNVSRFINHSCDPNLRIYSVYINNIYHEMPEIAFFAKRDIQAGEELTLKYYDLIKQGKRECKCASCR